MNPDLRAAIVAWLLADPAIVLAFGDTAAAPKFWSDWAGPDVAEPYLVLLMLNVNETYESDGSSVAQGMLIAAVFAAGRTEADALANQVGVALQDAPLVFGVPLPGLGTISAANGSYDVIFSDIQPSSLAGATIAIGGDTSDGTYVVSSGSDLDWALTTPFGGDTVAGTDWAIVQGSGTVSAIKGSAAITFSVAQAPSLLGVSIVIDGDSSGGIYALTGGGAHDWTLAGPFGGTTLSGATWTAVDQSLLYFRRTARSFPVVTAIGPDGAAVSTPSYAQFKFLIEKPPAA